MSIGGTSTWEHVHSTEEQRQTSIDLYARQHMAGGPQEVSRYRQIALSAFLMQPNRLVSRSSSGHNCSTLGCSAVNWQEDSVQKSECGEKLNWVRQSGNAWLRVEHDAASFDRSFRLLGTTM